MLIWRDYLNDHPTIECVYQYLFQSQNLRAILCHFLKYPVVGPRFNRGRSKVSFSRDQRFGLKTYSVLLYRKSVSSFQWPTHPSLFYCFPFWFLFMFSTFKVYPTHAKVTARTTQNVNWCSGQAGTHALADMECNPQNVPSGMKNDKKQYAVRELHLPNQKMKLSNIVKLTATWQTMTSSSWGVSQQQVSFHSPKKFQRTRSFLISNLCI